MDGRKRFGNIFEKGEKKFALIRVDRALVFEVCNVNLWKKVEAKLHLPFPWANNRYRNKTNSTV